MTQAANELNSKSLAYLRGPEDEPGMQTDLKWDHTTVPAALRRCVSKWGERELLVFADRPLSINDFAVQVSRFARGLMFLGVAPGDHVAVWLANLPEYAVAEFAIAAVGASMVPLNIRYKKEELEFALRQSDSTILIFAPTVLKTDCAGMLREICPELAEPKTAQPFCEKLPKLKHLIVLGGAVSGARSFGEVMALGDTVSATELAKREAEVRPESILVLQYTSGTTAFPKAAMLSHGQSLRNAFQMAKRAGFTDEDRVLSAMPMFHVGGSVCALLGAITIGYRLYTSSSFDAGETLRLIENEKITRIRGPRAHVSRDPQSRRFHEALARDAKKRMDCRYAHDSAHGGAGYWHQPCLLTLRAVRG